MKCPDDFAQCVDLGRPTAKRFALPPPYKRKERHRAKGAVSVRKMVESLVPAFCWNTAQEVLEMLELVDDTIEKALVARVIFELVRHGKMLKRPIKTPRFPGQADGKRRGPKGLYEYRMADFSQCREVGGV